MCAPYHPNKFKALIPKVMVFGGEAIWGWLGHEGEACMNGISAPIRRDTKEMNFPQLEATEEGGSLKTRKTA